MEFTHLLGNTVSKKNIRYHETHPKTVQVGTGVCPRCEVLSIDFVVVGFIC